MEAECGLLMRMNMQENHQAAIQGLTSGRLWTACLSCPKMAVLISKDWGPSPNPKCSGRFNGFILTICGACARKKMADDEEDWLGHVQVWRETVERSRTFRGVANFCAASGLGELSYIGERVQDRRVLLQDHVQGIIVKSVRLCKDKEMETVEVLDHVELGYS